MLIRKTKIALSPKELELVCNTDWILTKHIIIQKATDLLGEALLSMQEATDQKKGDLPEVFFVKSPKISKGENYRQLPYVVLDYPRFFDRENTLAIRTFFWWGNFFSINLQLSGKIKNDAAPNLLAHFLQLQKNDYWICVHNHPWEHHFETDNYVPIQTFTHAQFETILHNETFIKIGKKISLQHWGEKVAVFIKDSFEEMMQLLKT
jgi:hypothetical protein